VHLHGYLLSFYQRPVGEIRSEIELVSSSHWKLSLAELEQNGSVKPTTCPHRDGSKMHSKEPLPLAKIPWFFSPTRKTRQHPATGSKSGISVNATLCREPLASWERMPTSRFPSEGSKSKRRIKGQSLDPSGKNSIFTFASCSDND
jgi:hypothetical protein